MDFITTTAVPPAWDARPLQQYSRPASFWVAIGLPRFARDFRKLQRNVPMLLRRGLVALGLQHHQGVNQLFARVLGADDSVNIATLRRHVRISKTFAEFFYLLASRFGDDVSLLFV